jgi:hypothetical protein
MAEGLSPGEISKGIQEHRERTEDSGHGDDSGKEGHKALTIVEAALLAIVAVMAAYSGYASAKWATESSLTLAKASAARTEASRVADEGFTTKNFDASTFNAWFTAYAVGNQKAMTVAERRFRPQFLVAFNAWLATDPFTNPHAPPGPTYMPQYVQPEQAQSNALDAQANRDYNLGATAGENSDNYVRIVVYLATVLFLVGISGHFRLRGARVGLVVVGGAILVFSVVNLIEAPKPPF